jgi:acyl-CoA thioester hydrolase
MPSTDTTFYVRYAETDAMSVVHHSTYIVWFEEGRSHYLRARGADYAKLEATGYFFALSELEARYIAPAHYGERVTVRTQLESLRSRSISLTYQVLNADSGQLLVTGRTELICVNRDGQVVRIPEAWRRLMRDG